MTLRHDMVGSQCFGGPCCFCLHLKHTHILNQREMLSWLQYVEREFSILG